MNSLKRTGKRMLAMLLCVMLVLTVPVLPATTASAANWLTPYLDKMTGWGIVKGDGAGNMNTGNTITRAEFVAMMNRAYGYTDVGPIPFTDVVPAHWFYEDICKAYTAGIFHGTSATKASPFAPITREQAITLIARNMRLDEIPGEIIDFTDGRLFSSYSRGYVQAAIAAGIIDGYSDGTCRPQQTVTRGEAIKMICVALGNLISTPGTHSPGGVYGNLTINCTNVTLKDTIITGDLYISGGISLGDVILENVQVRGRIVVAGGGSSELGQNSILLRGVDADKLIVDAPTGQYISVRTEGRTYIDTGVFRSDSYLEDGCRDGYGILNVSLEGDPGDSFTLSGNLETVVNRTPDSVLILGDAQAASVTVDEKATNSTLLLEVNASADEVNLDVGTSVEGSGDIGHLIINSAGSSTTMLPDQITIRPGLDADISGDQMDASQAQQYSEEPRILNGYPKVKNVAPTSADGVHSTNKKGVVYWGLTTAAVGAIPDTDEGKENLMAPSYGSGFLLYGNYEVETADTDFAIPDGLKGLTASGTYFISAVLVDSRGHTSPVYSERFETPDDIIPAFSSRDYPYMSSIEVEDSEVTVMANKNCDLYYALLPMGSTQPSTMDFLSFAGFDDALGYGRIHLSKNKTETQQVNRLIYPESMNLEDKVTELQEQATYDLYLWLADADGIKSSAITKLTFTTRDKTPPEFTTEMQSVGEPRPTSVNVNAVINEPGTIHWAIVKTGTEYPKLPKNWEQTYETLENFLMSEEAKFQLANHQNALKAGSITTNGNVNAAASITGLEKETAYDLYYVAVDKAGNYSEIVKKITVYTEDSTPPSVELTFSRLAPNTGVTNDPQPYADSDVRVVFSENILDSKTGDEPLELYQTINSGLATEQDKTNATTRLRRFLKESVQMYQRVGSTNTLVDIPYDTLMFNGSDNAVSLELDRDGKLVITFPGSVLNMGSGSTYFFQFTNITDASPQKNAMLPIDEKTPPFTTVSALAVLFESTSTVIPSADAIGNDDKAIDIAFTLTPESTNNADAGTYWDMMLWLDTTSTFELYRRQIDKDGTATNWKYVGTKRQLVSTGQVGGSSLVVMQKGSTNTLPFLLTGPGTSDEYLVQDTVYEFALHFTEMNGNNNRDAFNGRINCEVTVITGTQNNVSGAFIELDKDKLNESIKNGSVKDISSPQGFSITKPFSDQTAPLLANNQPTFTPGDSGVTITLSLKDNRVGRVHYLIAPEKVFYPLDESGDPITMDDYDATKVIRADHIFKNPGSASTETSKVVSRPIVDQVVQPDATLGEFSDSIVHGVVNNVGSASMPLSITGLMPNETYYAYFVTQGSSNQYSEVIYIYKFKTLDVTRPVLTLRQEGSTIKVLTSLPSTTEINYIIVPYSDQMGSELYKYIDPNDSNNTVTTGGTGAKRIYELMDLPATDSTKGSMFDDTAGSMLKRTLSNYIRSQSANSQSILGFGSGTATSARELAVDCTDSKFDLKYETDYCLVAVGRSALSNADNPESYAFRATFPFRLQDTQAPKVTSAITYTTSMTTDGQFTGTVTLNFDKTLYCTTSTSGLATLRTISTGIKDIDDTKNANYISANSNLVISARNPGTIEAYTTSSESPASTTSITLDFKQVNNNASVTFTSTLCNASRATRSPALTVTVKITKDRNGEWVVDAEIPDAWKA